MNTKALSSIAATLFVALLTTGCGSTNDGVLGNTRGTTTAPAADEIRGTVYEVDTTNRVLVLTNVDPMGTNGLVSGGNDVRVYYDDRTTVTYQGSSTYKPSDLERGDQVAVRVSNANGRTMANSIEVLYDSSRGGTAASGGGLRGIIRRIDTNRRTIEIDRGVNTSSVVVEYDLNTRVLYNNQSYRPEDLERGDEVAVDARRLSDGRTVAYSIEVLRSVSDPNGASSGSSAQATVRGTVRYVDASRQTIEIERATWSRNFTTGGSSGSSVILEYSSGLSVEFQGRSYPVTNLERGDEIEATVRQVGSRNVIDQIRVVRDANSF